MKFESATRLPVRNCWPEFANCIVNLELICDLQNWTCVAILKFHLEMFMCTLQYTIKPNSTNSNSNSKSTVKPNSTFNRRVIVCMQHLFSDNRILWATSSCAVSSQTRHTTGPDNRWGAGIILYHDWSNFFIPEQNEWFVGIISIYTKKWKFI